MPTSRLFNAVLGAVALAAAALAGYAGGWRDGRGSGYRLGRIDAAYSVSAEAVDLYLSCLGEPPTCER